MRSSTDRARCERRHGVACGAPRSVGARRHRARTREAEAQRSVSAAVAAWVLPQRCATRLAALYGTQGQFTLRRAAPSGCLRDTRRSASTRDADDAAPDSRSLSRERSAGVAALIPRFFECRHAIIAEDELLRAGTIYGQAARSLARACSSPREAGNGTGRALRLDRSATGCRCSSTSACP